MAGDVFGIVGSVIAGAYHVEAVVAEGGFGVVYRAHHGGFRAPVALKCLKLPQRLSEEHQVAFLEQFRGEAELLFRLSSSLPTVVRPLHIDAMTTADKTFVPFMVLEWLEGETLDAIIQRKHRSREAPLTLPRLMELLSPVALALDKAHHFTGPHGPVCVVHRDLKPENIFVARVAGEEVVKILDFGIGKVKSVVNQAAGRLSQEAGISSFTPAYGAPEQWAPKKYGQTGPWTDIWGLALTMVESLAGQPVIDGDQHAIMGAVLDESRRPTPRNEHVDVSDAVETVFTKALAVDPRTRYASVREFWGDLSAAMGQQEGAFQTPQSAPVKKPSGTRPAVSIEEIPDLNLAPTDTRMRRAPADDRAPGRMQEFEAEPAGGLSLDLDLTEEEAKRLSRPPSLPNPSARPAPPPVEAAPRSTPPSSGKRPSQRPPASTRPAPQAVVFAQPQVAIENSLFKRALPGVCCIGASVALTIFDQIYSAIEGEVLTVGSMRLTWIAVPALFVGVGLVVYRLLPRS